MCVQYRRRVEVMQNKMQEAVRNLEVLQVLVEYGQQALLLVSHSWCGQLHMILQDKGGINVQLFELANCTTIYGLPI